MYRVLTLLPQQARYLGYIFTPDPLDKIWLWPSFFFSEGQWTKKMCRKKEDQHSSQERTHLLCQSGEAWGTKLGSPIPLFLLRGTNKDTENHKTGARKGPRYMSCKWSIKAAWVSSPAPLAPKISSKSFSFQSILRGKLLFWANFGIRPPLGSQLHWAPLTKILDPPLWISKEKPTEIVERLKNARGWPINISLTVLDGVSDTMSYDLQIGAELSRKDTGKLLDWRRQQIEMWLPCQDQTLAAVVRATGAG